MYQPGQSIPASVLETNRQCSVDFSEAAMHTIDSVTQADVLYILDCCFAASFAIQGRRELLAACGIEHKTPQAGFESFTRVLIQSLEKINGAPITVAHLHGYMFSQYYEDVLSTTPIHVEFSERMQASGSIVLARLVRGSTKLPPHRQVAPQPIPRDVPNPPKVLLSITLSDRSDPPSADQWKAWLRSMPGEDNRCRYWTYGILQVVIICHADHATHCNLGLLKVWSGLRVLRNCSF